MYIFLLTVHAELVYSSVTNDDFVTIVYYDVAVTFTASYSLFCTYPQPISHQRAPYAVLALQHSILVKRSRDWLAFCIQSHLFPGLSGRARKQLDVSLPESIEKLRLPLHLQSGLTLCYTAGTTTLDRDCCIFSNQALSCHFDDRNFLSILYSMVIEVSFIFP